MVFFSVLSFFFAIVVIAFIGSLSYQCAMRTGVNTIDVIAINSVCFLIIIVSGHFVIAPLWDMDKYTKIFIFLSWVISIITGVFAVFEKIENKQRGD